MVQVCSDIFSIPCALDGSCVAVTGREGAGGGEGLLPLGVLPGGVMEGHGGPGGWQSYWAPSTLPP